MDLIITNLKKANTMKKSNVEVTRFNYGRVLKYLKKQKLSFNPKNVLEAICHINDTDSFPIETPVSSMIVYYMRHTKPSKKFDIDELIGRAMLVKYGFLDTI